MTAFGETFPIYEKLLNERGKIYIGKGRLSNSFIEEYGNFLIQKTKKYSSDIQEEAIAYAIENFLYIEKNFSEKEKILEVFKKEIKKGTKQIIIKKYYEDKMNYSLDSPVNFYTTKGEKDTIQAQTRDKKVDVHKEVINLIDQEESDKDQIANRCIEKMQEYLEKGMSKSLIIKKVAKEMKINKEQMLEIVNQELKRRITMNGDYEER